jgi:hypothetical protein
MRRALQSMAVFTFLLAISAIDAAAQRTKPTDSWKPDAALLKQLEAPIKVGDYSIRIPKGYEKQQPNTPTPEGVSVWGWTGAPRRDGTKPSITMMIMTPPPAQREQIKAMTLEQVAGRFIEGQKRQRTNWKIEASEKGTVNGLSFVRMRWSGVNPAQNMEMRGVLYVARDGNTLIQMASQDPTAHSKQTLALAEAAVLTFKQK